MRMIRREYSARKPWAKNGRSTGTTIHYKWNNYNCRRWNWTTSTRGKCTWIGGDTIWKWPKWSLIFVANTVIELLQVAYKFRNGKHFIISGSRDEKVGEKEKHREMKIKAFRWKYGDSGMKTRWVQSMPIRRVFRDWLWMMASWLVMKSSMIVFRWTYLLWFSRYYCEEMGFGNGKANGDES